MNAKTEKIGREAAEANDIATAVQSELDKALPALQAAEEALNVLTKKDMSELKAYAKPPALVELTLGGVMTVLNRPATWEESKKALGDASFMEKLVRFDKVSCRPSTTAADGCGGAGQTRRRSAEKDSPIYDAGGFHAGGHWKRLLRRKRYGVFARRRRRMPKGVAQDYVCGCGRWRCTGTWRRRSLLRERNSELRKRTWRRSEQIWPALRSSWQKYWRKCRSAPHVTSSAATLITVYVQSLRERYEESTSNKKALETELTDLEEKLERAHKLVTGLAEERQRWEGSIASLERQIHCLPGDVALAIAFMSYCGPFPSEYRTQLVHQVNDPPLLPSPDGAVYRSGSRRYRSVRCAPQPPSISRPLWRIPRMYATGIFRAYRPMPLAPRTV